MVEEGEIATLKSNSGRIRIDAVVVVVAGPADVAVTVNVMEPWAAELVVLIVSLDVKGGVPEAGLKDEVTPLGRGEIERDVGRAAPVTVTSYVADCPAVTCLEEGAMKRLNGTPGPPGSSMTPLATPSRSPVPPSVREIIMTLPLSIVGFMMMTWPVAVNLTQTVFEG